MKPCVLRIFLGRMIEDVILVVIAVALTLAMIVLLLQVPVWAIQTTIILCLIMLFILLGIATVELFRKAIRWVLHRWDEARWDCENQGNPD